LPASPKVHTSREVNPNFVTKQRECTTWRYQLAKPSWASRSVS